VCTRQGGCCRRGCWRPARSRVHAGDVHAIQQAPGHQRAFSSKQQHHSPAEAGRTATHACGIAHYGVRAVGSTPELHAACLLVTHRLPPPPESLPAAHLPRWRCAPDQQHRCVIDEVRRGGGRRRLHAVPACRRGSHRTQTAAPCLTARTWAGLSQQRPRWAAVGTPPMQTTEPQHVSTAPQHAVQSTAQIQTSEARHALLVTPIMPYPRSKRAHKTALMKTKRSHDCLTRAVFTARIVSARGHAKTNA
jgi:hypothetical protein